MISTRRKSDVRSDPNLNVVCGQNQSHLPLVNMARFHKPAPLNPRCLILGEATGTKMGSARESDEVGILGGFLESDEFGLSGSQALSFQE